MNPSLRTRAGGRLNSGDLLGLVLNDARLRSALETLLSSLSLVRPAGLPSSILFCSTQPEEGKTTLAAALAISIGITGKQVVLIDADQRRPRIHEIFKLSNKAGFTDVVAGRANAEDVLKRLQVRSDQVKTQSRVSVIPSGPPDESLFTRVGRNRLRAVIDALVDSYEVVLIDCPPALAFNDALFLAPVVDGIVFVVEAGSVLQQHAKLAKKRLENAGGTIFGFVLNCFDDRRHGNAYNPYASDYL